MPRGSSSPSSFPSTTTTSNQSIALNYDYDHDNEKAYSFFFFAIFFFCLFSAPRYGLEELSQRHLLDLLKTSSHFSRATGGDYVCAVLFRTFIESSMLTDGEHTRTDDHDLELSFMLYLLEHLRNRPKLGHSSCIIENNETGAHVVTLSGVIGVIRAVFSGFLKDEVVSEFISRLSKQAVPPPQWYFRLHSKISNLRLKVLDLDEFFLTSIEFWMENGSPKDFLTVMRTYARKNIAIGLPMMPDAHSNMVQNPDVLEEMSNLEKEKRRKEEEEAEALKGRIGKARERATAVVVVDDDDEIDGAGDNSNNNSSSNISNNNHHADHGDKKSGSNHGGEGSGGNNNANNANNYASGSGTNQVKSPSSSNLAGKASIKRGPSSRLLASADLHQFQS